MGFVRRRALLVAAVIASSALSAAIALAGNDIGLVTLVDDMAQRLALAQSVAAVKFSRDTPIGDAAREQQVLDDVAAAAARDGLEAGPVVTLFRDQIEAAVALEQDRVADWTTYPAHLPASEAALQDLRVQIDTINQQIVKDVAQQQEWLRAPSCRDELDDALTVVAARRAMDEPGRNALARASRDLCQLWG